jgi:hypothetical protein
MSDQSGKAWRKANPDKYRVYQRDLMRKRRAAAKLALESPPVSAVEEAAGIAALQGCLDREPMTQLRWRQMSEFERRRHLAEMGVDSQEKMVDYLRGLAEG